MKEPCKATKKSCGTPTGWRQGGRCPRCRAAHNEDTAKRRRARNAPDPATIAKYAAEIETGVDPASAARRLGINSRQAQTLFKDHPIVADALARQEGGRPAPASMGSRQADYLKALIEHGGSVAAAWRSSAVSESTLTKWRANVHFAAAEHALREWLSRRSVAPRRAYSPRASRSQFERLLELLQDPRIGINTAASQVGLGASSIRHRAAMDAEFMAKLDALRPVGPGGRRRRPIAAVDTAWLRQEWAGNRTTAEIAADAAISVTKVKQLAHGLGLPPRR